MRTLTITEKLKVATELLDKHDLAAKHPGLSYALQIKELEIITKTLSEHGLSAEYTKQCNALQGTPEPGESTIPVVKEEDNSD